MYEHQDYRDFVVRKTPPSNAHLKDPKLINNLKRNNNPYIDTQAKQSSNKHGHDGPLINPKKLEEGEISLPRISPQLKQTIITARNQKKLTQAQLAQQINEKHQIVQEYENGKAIPNPQVLNKMSKVLGVHLKR